MERVLRRPKLSVPGRRRRIFLYVVCSKNMVIITGENVYETEFIN
jgi:hypothetical protein